MRFRLFSAIAALFTITCPVLAQESPKTLPRDDKPGAAGAPRGGSFGPGG